MVNSMLIGQQWNFIQLLSPFLSFNHIAYRFLYKSREWQESVIQITLIGLANVCCILPVFVFVLSTYHYADERPDWARHFDTVEYEFDDSDFPAVRDTFGAAKGRC